MHGDGIKLWGHRYKRSCTLRRSPVICLREDRSLVSYEARKVAILYPVTGALTAYARFSGSLQGCHTPPPLTAAYFPSPLFVKKPNYVGTTGLSRPDRGEIGAFCFLQSRRLLLRSPA